MTEPEFEPRGTCKPISWTNQSVVFGDAWVVCGSVCDASGRGRSGRHGDKI